MLIRSCNTFVSRSNALVSLSAVGGSSPSTRATSSAFASTLPGSTTAYDGHNWLLGPNWAFHAETAVHALRLIGSGIFDECPGLRVVLGHLGEGIPVYLWRIDGRNGWMKAPHKYAAKHGVGHYFRKHFHLTTSGNFSTPALVNAIAEMGADRIMFSIDWPFEAIDEGAEWLDKAAISDSDRVQIGRDNAIKLFKLKLA